MGKVEAELADLREVRGTEGWRLRRLRRSEDDIWSSGGMMNGKRNAGGRSLDPLRFGGRKQGIHRLQPYAPAMPNEYGRKLARMDSSANGDWLEAKRGAGFFSRNGLDQQHGKDHIHDAKCYQMASCGVHRRHHFPVSGSRGLELDDRTPAGRQRTIQRLVLRRRIPIYHVGRSPRYLASDLLTSLRSSRGGVR